MCRIIATILARRPPVPSMGALAVICNEPENGRLCFG
jgi:hypothetical protein